MINPQWLELPMSRTNFHDPKDVPIEVRLYDKRHTNTEELQLRTRLGMASRDTTGELKLRSFRHPSLGKTYLFAWRFILNENILFRLTISYYKPFFCFCVLCSNNCPKIKFTDKKWSDLCNLYKKSVFFFFNFVKENIFLLFFAEFEYLMFYKNIVKISEKSNEQNLKICLQVIYPIDFCIVCVHFYYGEKWKYLIFRNQCL